MDGFVVLVCEVDEIHSILLAVEGFLWDGILTVIDDDRLVITACYQCISIGKKADVVYTISVLLIVLCNPKTSYSTVCQFHFG